MGKTLLRSDANRLPRQFGFTPSSSAGSSAAATMANELFLHGAGNGDSLSSAFWPSVDNGNVDHFGLSSGGNSGNSGGPFTPSAFSSGSGEVPGDMQFPLMTPPMGHHHHQFIPLRCTECGIAKPGCEELEIHIKVEHLNWLPFVCPVCNSERASDTQMREHLHSAHRKGNSNRYIYLDNPKAKHTLQVLLDRALYGYVSRLREQNPVTNLNSFNTNDDGLSKLLGNNDVSRKRFGLNGSNGLDKNLGVSSIEDLVDIDPNANITEGHGGIETGLVNDEDLDDETNLQLNTIFGAVGKMSKSDFDFDHNASGMDLHDNSDLLGNVAALFSTNPEKSNSSSRSSLQQPPRRRGVNRINPKTNTAKKRVLGLCSRCQKPVTAGARQMHMYFHLSKDSDTYRFRCKFSGCTVQHYRKDQMENHMVKVHGRIEPNLIEDRTTELFDACQKLSMETLGTTGNNPGPTAAEAQAIYDQQQEEFQETPRVAKRKATSHQSYEPSTSKVAKTSNFLDLTGNEGDSKIADDQMIECKLCKKSLLNRIRGFHILWHMAKDLGINRYACKHCSYGHDRSQSVQRHGKLEHGDENSCEDTIVYHHKEIKQMSQKCFGIDAVFAQDTRRPKKFPMQVREDEGNLGELEIVDDDDSVIIEELEESPNVKEEEFVEEEEAQEERKVVPLKINTSGLKTPKSEPKEKENSASSSSKTKKPALYRIFGRRKPSSRTKRNHVAKLREISVKLGGSLYFKRKMNEVAHCELCGKLPNRMSEHATIDHMDGFDLFLCPRCGIGHNSRDFLCRHIRDAHESTQTPIDNRFKWAQEVKNYIKKCYPSFFVDAPLPPLSEIKKLKNELQMDEIIVGDESDGEQEGEGEIDVDGEDEEEEEGEEIEHEDVTSEQHSEDQKKSQELEDEEEEEDDLEIEGEVEHTQEEAEEHDSHEDEEEEEGSEDQEDDESASGSGGSHEDESVD
ncbi:hypothetical protein L596_011409 [Steinernema carpocapsae]|uniref:C2H2-type domain-containing protein n=1 Tax=Steinernema carpocapsae TaxID=34508 RepID=A0A4U5NUK6_STECR|nr:hypothetical protein L596_011409 [Steinernema carpocapsae]